MLEKLAHRILTKIGAPSEANLAVDKGERG